MVYHLPTYRTHDFVHHLSTTLPHEAEFAAIKKRADELTAEFKRLSPEYTKLMERTEQINKEHRALMEQHWALEE